MRPDAISDFLKEFPLPHTIATKTFVTDIANEIEKSRLFWKEENNYIEPET